MKHRALLLVGLFVAALLIGLVAGALWWGTPEGGTTAAQPQASPEPTEEPVQTAFEGMVFSVSPAVPGTWLVGVYPIEVVTETQIISNGLPVVPGVWARVEAVKVFPTGLQAAAIELQEVPQVSLLDRIMAINSSTSWQVGSTQVRLDDDTTLVGDPDVGQLALVRGVTSLEGVDADYIEIVPLDQRVAFQGVIEAIHETSWVVDDVTVEVDEDTVIVGEPAVGMQAQVLGIESSPRVVQAVHIEVAAEFQASQLAGWLIGIDGTGYPYLWRVNLVGEPLLHQIFLAVHEDTEIDTSAGPSTPGAWLDITARREGDSFYRAERITVLSHPPKQEIVGLIEELPEAGLFGQWNVSGFRVAVDNTTGILGTPAVGSLVWIAAIPDYANLYQAELIEVLAP